jgi:hypothetical protein
MHTSKGLQQDTEYKVSAQISVLIDARLMAGSAPGGRMPTASQKVADAAKPASDTGMLLLLPCGNMPVVGTAAPPPAAAAAVR